MSALQSSSYLPQLEQCDFLFDPKVKGVLQGVQALSSIRPKIAQRLPTLDLLTDQSASIPNLFELHRFNNLFRLHLKLTDLQQIDALISVLSHDDEAIPTLLDFKVRFYLEPREGVPMDLLERMLSSLCADALLKHWICKVLYSASVVVHTLLLLACACWFICH